MKFPGRRPGHAGSDLGCSLPRGTGPRQTRQLLIGQAIGAGIHGNSLPSPRPDRASSQGAQYHPSGSPHRARIRSVRNQHDNSISRFAKANLANGGQLAQPAAVTAPRSPFSPTRPARSWSRHPFHSVGPGPRRHRDRTFHRLTRPATSRKLVGRNGSRGALGIDHRMPLFGVHTYRL